MWRCAHSYDGGLTWPISALGAEQDGFQHDEPALVDLPDGRVLMVMRENVHTSRPSHYVISEDEGYVWSTPRPGPFYGDRPAGGVAAEWPPAFHLPQRRARAGGDEDEGGT